MIIHKKFFLRCPCSLREQLRDVSLPSKVGFINKLSLDLNEGQLKNFLKVCNLIRYVQKPGFSASPHSIKYL
jgi:hypothetical protein